MISDEGMEQRRSWEGGMTGIDERRRDKMGEKKWAKGISAPGLTVFSSFFLIPLDNVHLQQSSVLRTVLSSSSLPVKTITR